MSNKASRKKKSYNIPAIKSQNITNQRGVTVISPPSSTTPEDEEAPLPFRLANTWTAGVVSVVTIIVSNILGALLQIKPLEFLWRKYQTVSFIVVALLIVFTSAAVSIKIYSSSLNRKKNVGKSTKRKVQYWVYTSLILPTTSISLLFIWVFMSLFHPGWCPEIVCQSPQIVTNTHGTHDESLDVYFIALQSSSYVISSDPTRYTLKNLPEEIGIVQTDRRKHSSLYRVIIGLHSLRQSDSIIVDEVNLLVSNLPPMPSPLNVWTKESPIMDYSSTPYRAHYQGERSGDSLPAIYVPYPNFYLQLASGEAEQLDIQIVSSLVTNLVYRVQIVYHIANDLKRYKLIMDKNFDVVFADSWYQYSLNEKGRFMKKP